MGEVKTMTTRKIIFDSKNIPCDIAYVEWVLKSDYDALKQLSDAFYLKQVQLENQNEDLKAKLEKAEMILKEMLEDGLCLQGQEHDFAIGIREYLKGEG